MLNNIFIFNFHSAKVEHQNCRVSSTLFAEPFTPGIQAFAQYSVCTIQICLYFVSLHRCIRQYNAYREVVCGLILAFVPGALKHYANILLLALCLTHIIFVWIATATQIEPDTDEKSKDERPKSRASQLGLQACSTELVFSLLLACRLLMVAQNARHVSSIAEEEKEKSASSAAISEAEFAKLSSALPEIDSLPDVSKGDPAEMALCLKQLGEMKRRLEQAKAAASS